MIDDIAFQTNLLALPMPAGRRPAGPGEAGGKGFAVVAQGKSRDLAGTPPSANAAKEIKNLIEREKRRQVESGVDLGPPGRGASMEPDRSAQIAESWPK